MNAEKLTVFLGNEGIATMRAGEAERCRNNLAGTESLTADFALELTVTAIIIVNEMMWSTT